MVHDLCFLQAEERGATSSARVGKSRLSHGAARQLRNHTQTRFKYSTITIEFSKGLRVFFERRICPRWRVGSMAGHKNEEMNNLLLTIHKLPNSLGLLALCTKFHKTRSSHEASVVNPKSKILHCTSSKRSTSLKDKTLNLLWRSGLVFRGVVGTKFTMNCFAPPYDGLHWRICGC